MSDIEIRISHSIPLGRARKEAEQVAKQLKRRFAVDYSWSGNTLELARQGVTGEVDVTPAAVDVRVKLGLLFSFLKPQIEKQIRHELGKVFGSSPGAVAKPAAAKKVRSTKAARSPRTPTASRRKG